MEGSIGIGVVDLSARALLVVARLEFPLAVLQRHVIKEVLDSDTCFRTQDMSIDRIRKVSEDSNG